MKNKLPVVVTLFALALIHSCSKEEESKVAPVINFKTGADYTGNGDTVAVGGRLYFGVQARGNTANITNFTIKKKLSDGTEITMMDTGLNSINLDVDKIFHQNVEDTVDWIFTVMDRDRLSNSLSLRIFKDPDSQFGGIYYHPCIKVGYQSNTEFGHFLDPVSGDVYFEDSATLLQSTMDMLFYYIVDEELPSPVLSSPGEMDNFSVEAKTFYPAIIDWQTRKYTQWDISVDDDPVSAEAFDNCFNDSLLIVSYHVVWGKKKFKWATSGRVIPFLTGDGKLGLIKVINAEHTENGILELALKIQQ
ncbi:MAG: hypothetical protein JXA03_04675 [Bacteroidales bacterium]|nr:hypothetical protein [Bacteroidales bacterium]